MANHEVVRQVSITSPLKVWQLVCNVLLTLAKQILRCIIEADINHISKVHFDGTGGLLVIYARFMSEVSLQYLIVS